MLDFAFASVHDWPSDVDPTFLYAAFFFFFFNDPATTEIYTLPLHDALPISRNAAR
mgnify:CR=1 FL=1